MTSEEKKKGKGGKVAGIIVAIIIILIVVGITWGYFASWDSARAAMEKGCTPLTDNAYGIPTTFRCPPGVYLN